MNKLIVTMIVFMGSHCYANMTEADTVDCWMIYNRPELLLTVVSSGIQETTIKAEDLKDLKVEYYQCGSIRHIDVVIKVSYVNDDGIHTMENNVVAGNEMILLKRSELSSDKPKELEVHYRQKSKGGVDLILARIKLTR